MRGVHAGGDAVFHGPIHGFPEIALLRYIHKPAAGRFLRLFRGLWPNGAGRQLRDVLPVYMLRIVLAATLLDALRFLRGGRDDGPFAPDVARRFACRKGLLALFPADAGLIIDCAFRTGGCFLQIGFLRLFLIKYVRMGELRLDHIAAHRTQDRKFLGRAAGMIRKMRREIALFRAALRLARMPVAAFIL